MSNDWEFIKTMSKGDENSEAKHPLEDFERLDDMRLFLDDMEDLHKNHYDELRIKFYFRSLGYGAVESSYVLEGRYLDPTKRLLYGKQQ